MFRHLHICMQIQWANTYSNKYIRIRTQKLIFTSFQQLITIKVIHLICASKFRTFMPMQICTQIKWFSMSKSKRKMCIINCVYFYIFFDSKVKGSDNQEKLVYQIIEDAGNKGKILFYSYSAIYITTVSYWLNKRKA